jgi:hypothetical protein
MSNNSSDFISTAKGEPAGKQGQWKTEFERIFTLCATAIRRTSR